MTVIIDILAFSLIYFPGAYLISSSIGRHLAAQREAQSTAVKPEEARPVIRLVSSR